jgi:formylmethanofuran dehydrogenase subunit E
MIVKSALRSPREIAGYSFEEYKEMVRQFHGSEAPGLLIGGFMVALALQHLPANTLYDAICETRTCLPDAIQLLTPCTVGNGWLKIVPFGRYALTLYDKTNGNHEGVRVFLDPGRVIDWPEIYAWFFKLKNSTEQLGHGLTGEIQDAGSDILSMQIVKIAAEFFVKKHKGKIAVCPRCDEAYPLQDGKICLACQGNEVYL